MTCQIATEYLYIVIWRLLLMITRVGAHATNIVLLVFTLRFRWYKCIKLFRVFPEELIHHFQSEQREKENIGRENETAAIEQAETEFFSSSEINSAQRDIKCCCLNLNFWSSANNLFKEISHNSSCRIWILLSKFMINFNAVRDIILRWWKYTMAAAFNIMNYQLCYLKILIGQNKY